ncbi:hypothetical protein CDIK_4480, partial [Cucumispora dikerogammari]
MFLFTYILICKQILCLTETEKNFIESYFNIFFSMSDCYNKDIKYNTESFFACVYKLTKLIEKENEKITNFLFKLVKHEDNLKAYTNFESYNRCILEIAK